MTSLTALSLYAGCGGLDSGLHQAGVQTVWANEHDPDAAATHTKALPGVDMHVGDVAEARLPSTRTVDLVVGGPPCQGFSVAGKMDPNDPRSKHVWTFLDVVETMEPRAFIMENVKALALNKRFSHLLPALRVRAGELGYGTQLMVLNAADHGVPQARERMFLIGVHGSQPDLRVETSPRTSLRSCLASLPPLGEPGNDRLCAAKVTPARRPVLRKSPYAGMLFNGQGRPMDPDQPAPTLPASMGGNRTPIVDQQHLDGADPWIPPYHRHLMSGGEPYDRIPLRMRRLSVQEAAAIQTFPAGMEWVGPQSAVYRQIGNAVPPELGRRVGVALLEQLH